MKNAIDHLVEELFDHSKLIPISDIPFDMAVRKLCEQNACGKFGSCWTCPPAIGEVQELQDSLADYKDFLVFYKVYTLEDSFDWEGMINSVKDFQKKILQLKKQIQYQDPDFSFLVLGAGACMLCEKCTYPQNEPCRLPEHAIFSVEAFGIDAMKMMRDNDLKYNNGPNTVTYIGGIFYR